METAKALSNIKCFFDRSEMFIENEGVNKVVCLADGRVVEMFNDNIIGSCDTSYLNPSDLSVFHSFEPLVKYYIIKENTRLGVLRKINGNLEIFRTYESIQKYEICDFLIIGRPQVKIWLQDEMEPLLTDFTSNNLCHLKDQTTLQEFSDLDHKLHMLQSSLAHAREISKNREELLKNYFKQLCNEESPLTLTCEPWQRIENNRWIICMSIKNNCKHELEILQLLINNGINSDIETKICNLMYFKPKQFFTRKKLLPDCCVNVVGIVKEPDFSYWKDVINLSCSLLYKVSNIDDNNIKEMKIPPFILNIEDLLNKNLSILNSDGENLMQDIIVCAAVYEMILLNIFLKALEIETLITDTLLNKLHFNKFEIFESEKIHCFVIKCNSNSMLSGLVVFIENLSESDCILVCYSKHVNQVALFKRFLELFLKNDLLSISEKRISFSPEVPGSLLAAVNTLDEEFEHFTSAMRRAIPVVSSLPIKKETEMKFTAETWKGLVESNLQFNTDLQFQCTSKAGNLE